MEESEDLGVLEIGCFGHLCVHEVLQHKTMSSKESIKADNKVAAWMEKSSKWMKKMDDCPYDMDDSDRDDDEPSIEIMRGEENISGVERRKKLFSGLDFHTSCAPVKPDIGHDMTKSTHTMKRHTDEHDEGQGPSDPKRSCSAEKWIWTESCQKNLTVLEFDQNVEEDEQRNWEDDYPKYATFHTGTDEAAYKILNAADDQTDVSLQLRKLIDFSWTKTFDWSSLEDLLRRANYRRPSSLSSKQKWTSTEEIAVEAVEEGPMRRVWARLKLAFKRDFMNGDIKVCLLDIFEHAIKDKLGAPDLCVELPFPTSITNSYVQCSNTRDVQSPSDEVQSLNSSVLSIPKANKGIVVPDVIIYHTVEPLFVLNVECKTGRDRFGAGVLQCVKQMLSQMHWQDLHFGFLLSPRFWQIIVMQKQQRGIEIWQERFPLFKSDEEDPNFHNFHVDSFINFLDWTCRIISFRSRHTRLNNRKTSQKE